MSDQLTLRNLTARPVVLKLERPIVARIATIAEWPVILIDLETDEGVIGRSYLEPYLPKAMQYLIPALHDLGEALKGRRIAPIELYEAGRKALHFVGYQGMSTIAVAGIDMAAWDALSKAAGLPKIDVQHPGPAIRIRQCITAAADACIVHQKRNKAEPIGDFRRQAMHCCPISNVDHKRCRVAANLLRCSVEGCFAAIDHADDKTHARQPPCRRQADAARGTGDDGDIPSGELAHRGSRLVAISDRLSGFELALYLERGCHVSARGSGTFAEPARASRGLYHRAQVNAPMRFCSRASFCRTRRPWDRRLLASHHSLSSAGDLLNGGKIDLHRH
jgi:hypothetical protein